MLHAIICRKPFVYVSSERRALLELDHQYVIENSDIMLQGIKIPRKFEDFEAITGQELLTQLRREIPQKGIYYTFESGKLIEKTFNRRAQLFYVERGVSVRYPTYCNDSDVIRAGLFCKENGLPEKIGALTIDMLLHTEDYDVEGITLTTEQPLKQEEVLGYVCIPIVLEKIPVGTD